MSDNRPDLNQQPLPGSGTPVGQTSYLAQPPPDEPSSTAGWGRRVAIAALAIFAGYLLWSWLGSDSYGRVGPRPAEGRTVLVLLHGYGAPGDDLMGLAEEFSKSVPDASILIPEGPHRVALTGRSWVPNFQAPSRAEYIIRLAAEIEKTSALVWRVIDDARDNGARCGDIYVAGFSQGGRMAAEVALRAPAGCDLGGAIVMSGGGFDEVALPTLTGRVPMRVLITHGSTDRVVGLGKGRAIALHFEEDGHDVRWLQFKGPHTIPAVVRGAIPAFLRGETVGSPLDGEP